MDAGELKRLAAELTIIIDEYGFCVVMKGSRKIGTLRNFCCGVDFRPDGYQCLFSILHIKKDDPKVLDCIIEILDLELKEMSGHYNYHHSDYRTRAFDEIKKGFEKYYERTRI